MLALTPLATCGLAFAGFLAGFVDSIAGGGGLVTVPALLATGLDPRIVMGTNKGQATFGATVAFATYWRRGAIDRKRVPVGLVCGFFGSLIGAYLLTQMRPEPLRPLVLGLLVASVIVVSVPKDRWIALFARGKKRTSLLEDAPPREQNPLVLFAPLAIALGTYDGFFGPGVGTMLIVACVLVFGDGLAKASANAKIVNWASNLAALLLLSSRGLVNWPIALTMAGTNVVGSFVGARLALRVGDRLVRVLVPVVALSIATKIIVDMLR